ncbi:hypothetical protein FO519_010448, partial [Halicephalobus sp. NKZ332]
FFGLFAVDNSNGLNSADFQTELNFISKAIGDMNHGERIAVIARALNSISFGQYNDTSIIQSTVKSWNQISDSFSLVQILKPAYGSIAFFGNTTSIPKKLIVFVSDTNSENAIGNSGTYVDLIKDHGFDITFVLMGSNVDQAKLSNFSNSFVNWTDMSQPEPSDWGNSYGNVYGCASIQSTTQAGQTATTSSLTRPTDPGPDPGYTPCQEYVVVAADVTRLLTTDNFKVGYRAEFYQLHIFFHEPS